MATFDEVQRVMKGGASTSSAIENKQSTFKKHLHMLGLVLID